MTTININGTEFNLISVKAFEHKGEQRKELKLQKPNGRRFYFAVLYANGSMSEVV